MQATQKQTEKKSYQSLSKQLGEYGLQNGEDVTAFLENTPAGKATKERIFEEILIIEKLKKEQTEAAAQEEERHRLLLMLFILMIMYEDDATADELKERIEEDIQKVLHRKDAISEESSPVETSSSNFVDSIQNQIDKKIDQINELKKEEAVIVADEKDALNKFSIFNERINNFEDTVPSSVEEIDKKIDILTQKMENSALELNALIEAEEDVNHPKIRTNLHEMNALNLEVAHLKDQKDLLTGKKRQHIDSDSGETFLVPQEKKIIKHNGQLFLLNSDEELTSENQERALNDFKNASSSMISVKKVVNHNERLEFSELSSRKSNLQSKNDLVQSELLTLHEIKTNHEKQQKNIKLELSNPASTKNLTHHVTQMMPQTTKTSGITSPRPNTQQNNPTQPMNSSSDPVIAILKSISTQGITRGNFQALKRILNQRGLISAKLHSVMDKFDAELSDANKNNKNMRYEPEPRDLHVLINEVKKSYPKENKIEIDDLQKQKTDEVKPQDQPKNMN